MIDAILPECATPSRLVFDGRALADNWRSIDKMSASARTGAAVKANGYGLGARDVVRILSKAGCRDFYVAQWSEALAIADLVDPTQISVLNGVSENELALALALGAVPVLNTPAQVARWKSSGGGICDVMIDTGINRLGIDPMQNDFDIFDGLNIRTLLSHLASADQDSKQNDDQLKLFNSVSGQIQSTQRSLANSAGMMLGAAYYFDLTRPGLSLYGGIARPEMAEFIKPVVQWQAQVLQVRQLSAGDTIGYNATYLCREDMAVATVAAGYADGYWRSMSGSHVILNCTPLPVIGRVSMDLILLDARRVALVEGDWVDLNFDLPKVASHSGMSQYELLTGLSHRCDRMWI
jgi:alanine racemase